MLRDSICIMSIGSPLKHYFPRIGRENLTQLGEEEFIKKKFVVRPIEIIVERTGMKGFEKDRK